MVLDQRMEGCYVSFSYTWTYTMLPWQQRGGGGMKGKVERREISFYKWLECMYKIYLLI